MKAKRIILTTVSGLALGLAMQAAPTAPGATQDKNDTKTNRKSGVVRVVTTAENVPGPDNDKNKKQSHTVSVTDSNGEISVILNGTAVPEGQIKVNDGKIVIVDKDGTVLKTIDMSFDWADEHFGKWKDIATFIEDDWDLKGDVVVGSDDLFATDGTIATDMFSFEVSGDHPNVMLGVFLEETGEALCKHLHLENGASTMISEVLGDLPAAAAGLGKYDIIIGIDGRTSADPESIHKILGEKEPGDTITLRVIHNGEKKTVDVTLGKYDAEQMGRSQTWSRVTPKTRNGNRWFVTPPEIDFEDFGGNVVIPDGFDGEMQLFVHPEGIGEVMLELPDFEIDIEAESMHDAIREALERSKIDVELQDEVKQDVDKNRTRTFLRTVPRVRVKELRDADEAIRGALELRLKGLELHDMADDESARVHELLLEQLPKVQIERSLGDNGKINERMLHLQVPRIQQQLREARKLNDEALGKAGSEVRDELRRVKQRLESLESMIRQLLDKLHVDDDDHGDEEAAI